VAVIATATGGGFGNGSVDPEENKDVELAAVAFVTKYYERDGWTVRDVSASDLGWDLECTSNGQIHLVEVKGRKAAYPAFVTLTRRERTAFERAIDDEEWAKRYHLGVVHQATAKPTLRLYRHGKQHGWKCKITAKGISTQPLGLLIQPNS
jgi:hypothetical protein